MLINWIKRNKEVKRLRKDNPDCNIATCNCGDSVYVFRIMFFHVIEEMKKKCKKCKTQLKIRWKSTN